MNARACRHCGIRLALPPGSVCDTCFETVQVRYLDFACSNPEDCPHRVTASDATPSPR